ncbi:MAG: endopeptidase La [Deltaproteobacteria bacterium]|nr:MAG: endopeptidase La [Deltaproteobacteria bacterium]
MRTPSPPNRPAPVASADDRVIGPVLYLAGGSGDPSGGDDASGGDGGPVGGALDQVLPVLPLRNSVLYPGALMPLAVGRPKTLRLLNAVGTGGTIAVVSQREKDTDNPQPDELYWVGTSAKILRVHHEDENTLHVVVQGIERLRCTEFVQTEPYIIARVEHAPVEDEDSVEIQALIRSIKEMAAEIIELIPELPSGAVDLVNHIDSPSRLAYMVMTHLAVPVEDKQEVLQEDDVRMALRRALGVLNEQLEVLRVSQRINSEVKGEMNKNQREFFLRQQLKAIRKELGEEDDEEDFVEQLRERLMAAGLPDDAQKVANKELNRLRSIQPSSPEYTVARTYLEWLADLPWQKTTLDNHDIARARAILERDHDGLVKVKRRILEFLAVNSLKRDGRSPILCLVGPPGVGKTSLGKSVAEALGRKYQRMSLGGVRDEAEIRGHRRTYIGAMPGKFIQSMKRAESKNPVIILDEIDKVGRDWRGDPTSALLEVLDPEQNNTFMDHYLDVPFDLSKVMFIATANQLDTIPTPLLDRMEVIEVLGYTLLEKQAIARHHLIPKQLHEHGLTEAQLTITDEALDKIIVNYTREAGVRNLERKLAGVCRGVAVGIVERKWAEKVVDADAVADFLGPEVFIPEAAERTELPGIATGMAWTAVGGDILFIEATKMPGNGKLRLTGSLGDVMKESVELALSYMRSKASQYGIEDAVFKETDLHIHVPAGAIPKDGPSAGVTMFTALASLLTDTRVKGDVAMTGEITLRGMVLPVGGIKEKVLAAHRSGIRNIILPERNRKDVPDIPEEVRASLELHFVSRMDEVLWYALDKPTPGGAGKTVGTPGVGIA